MSALVVVRGLLVVEVFPMVKVLSVVSGLAPRWAAQQPTDQALRFFCEIAVALLGPLRSPARGKPAHHKRHIGHITPIRVEVLSVVKVLPVVEVLSVVKVLPVVKVLSVVSGLAPRGAAQQPQNQALRFF